MEVYWQFVLPTHFIVVPFDYTTFFKTYFFDHAGTLFKMPLFTSTAFHLPYSIIESSMFNKERIKDRIY